jgi:predicted  nucleic acid-binding Zn-ribbon protein
MGETLEALHRLQTVEIKLAALKQGRESKCRLVEGKNKNLKRLEEKLHERQMAVRELQSRIDLITLELTTREDAVSRHREGLNRAKTNKEYAAILAAMNTEKADGTKQEAELQKLLIEMEGLRSGQTDLETELAAARSDMGRAESLVAAYDKEVKGDLQRLTASRAELAAKVPPPSLAIFTKIAERHEGEALAAVIKIHPKRDEYSCAGCNMTLTLDVVNFLMTRDDIRICQSCGRILYLESTVGRPTPAKA